MAGSVKEAPELARRPALSLVLGLCYNIAHYVSGEQMVAEGEKSQALEVEGRQLRDYELLLIVSPEVAEEDLEATVDKVGQAISERGGLVSATEKRGKRKLAYPIGRFVEGTYVLIKLQLEPTQCQQLEAGFRISEEIIRHLLTRSDG
jgi:small subunit ribosomal protein S6